MPVEALRILDARASLAVAQLVFGATAYRDLSTRIELANGKLSVPELNATLPSGRLTGRLAVDAGQDAPPVELALHAPALSVHALLAQFGVASPLRGDAELELDVRGRGATPRAIAASLDGHLGLAMPRGTLDQGRADSLLGELWRVLLPGVARTGESPLRCAALRLESRAGQAHLRTLLVDSAIARITGSGSVNLAEERLGLNLVPVVRVAGAGVPVPVDVSGRFAAPSIRANPAGIVGALGGLAAQAGAGATTGATVGGPLGALLGGIVGAVRPGAEEDGCPAALASARARSGASR